ncbi:translesion DNA synthesis-associated protein ImuA [Corallincola platygyrae]|uniref:Translesion DNA synthesis-associated protein ImuA n=1 Tax=Corallincola platygyrae TaxID=1193278 RepID=A0ABW4XPP0_9GAMM
MGSLESLFDSGAIWQGRNPRTTSECSFPTQIAKLDDALTGGWRTGELIELLLSQPGIGELQLLLPAMAKQASRDAWQLWINPPAMPYAPALSAAGLELSQQLIVESRCLKKALWSAEQALKSGCCSCVLLWLPDPRLQASMTQLRRLQLAAEEGNALIFMLRPQWLGEQFTQLQSSPAATRLSLSLMEDGLSVELFKRRGSWALKPFTVDLSTGLQLPQITPQSTHQTCLQTSGADIIQGPWS